MLKFHIKLTKFHKTDFKVSRESSDNFFNIQSKITGEGEAEGACFHRNHLRQRMLRSYQRKLPIRLMGAGAARDPGVRWASGDFPSFRSCPAGCLHLLALHHIVAVDRSTAAVAGYRRNTVMSHHFRWWGAEGAADCYQLGVAAGD